MSEDEWIMLLAAPGLVACMVIIILIVGYYDRRIEQQRERADAAQWAEYEAERDRYEPYAATVDEFEGGD